MKLLVFGRHKDAVRNFQNLIRHELSFSKKPDIVISLGGDGTYLMAERKYPGVPKLLVKDSRVCKKCDPHSVNAIIKHLKEGSYKIRENIKLVADVKKGRKKIRIECTNDFVIRNQLPVYSLRFFLKAGKKTYNVIGDGCVVSTPFGSTAYYRSAGGRKFKKGIGIAFLNPIKRIKPLILPEKSLIRITIEREKAHFVQDNNPKMLILKPEDAVEIRKSRNAAKMIEFVH